MARTMSRRKSRLIMAVAAVVTVAGTGIAFAYWTATGSGTGSATTGQSTAFTIANPTLGQLQDNGGPVSTIALLAGSPAIDVGDNASVVATISPDGAGQTIDFTVTNPGPGTQNLTAVSVRMADANGTTWVPTGDCDIADYDVAITALAPVGPLAVGGTSEGTAQVTLTDSGANQDDCQGQTVPLYFVAS